jgi:hypothetical protein
MTIVCQKILLDNLLLTYGSVHDNSTQNKKDLPNLGHLYFKNRTKKNSTKKLNITTFHELSRTNDVSQSVRQSAAPMLSPI